MQVSLCVPTEDEKLPEFIKLQHRQDKQPISFAQDGVILTEKLAKKLGVSEGDEVTFKNGTKDIRLRVTGVTEHYAMDYAYLPRAIYEEYFGELKANELLLQIQDGVTPEQQQALSEALLKKEGVQQISYVSDLKSSFNDMIQSLNYVIIVLIVSASLLAFVVLYNLTNINIVERMREIATIKVLGFYDNEVSSYVFRENILLTIIGVAAGLLMGIVLHRFVVQTAEVDMVMFDRVIRISSYLISAVLTVFFSFAVNFVMYFKLKKVDMVESLKSID